MLARRPVQIVEAHTSCPRERRRPGGADEAAPPLTSIGCAHVARPDLAPVRPTRPTAAARSREPRNTTWAATRCMSSTAACRGSDETPAHALAEPPPSKPVKPTDRAPLACHRDASARSASSVPRMPRPRRGRRSRAADSRTRPRNRVVRPGGEYDRWRQAHYPHGVAASALALPGVASVLRAALPPFPMT